MIFKVIPGNNFIWNHKELLQFLIDNQGQPIELSTNREGCCCTSIGLYNLLDQFGYQHVTIYTCNPLERHNKYKIEIEHQWKFLKVEQPIDSKYHTWNKSSVFLTLYGRPLWHRIGLASYLRSLYSNKSIIGFLSDCQDQDRRSLYELTQLFEHDIDSIKHFAQAVDHFPSLVKDVDLYTPGQCETDGYVAQTQRIYQNIFVDVVAETFTSGDCLFITEKTIRPMLLKKPMIVMASKNYLDYLHQLGFQTFCNFWSEEYDGYSDKERYLLILKLIDSIAAKSLDELQDMYYSMQSVLDHNYNLLQTQEFKQHVRYID